MRIILDKDIPFLDGVLEPYADVLYLSPEEINPTIVRDVDALFVRTRTKINKDLLANSKVRFVATATIGFDHIDQDFCHEAGISWVSCPGCNAQAVCDYVEEVLNTLLPEGKPQTIGVVGYGHVGKLVAAMAERRGYRVLLSDPPLGIGLSLQQMAAQCDVITFHTPLTHDGKHPTYHMCDAELLAVCQPHTLFINAARGGVLDEQALLEYVSTSKGKEIRIAIDCWEGEPKLNINLLQRTDIATFHIAGYSIAGKMRASEMCLEAFCKFFSLPILSINKKAVPLQGDSVAGWLKRLTALLKNQPQDFEQLRKQYKLR